MTPTSKSWQDLSPTQKRAVAVIGAIESALTVAALRDLSRRPASEVRGPRPLWAAACFVQPVGPILYLVKGRRRAAG